MVVQASTEKYGEGLSMKFKEMSDDIVYFDASASDRQALLAFIDASIKDFETYTVDISNHGTGKENLEKMRDVISEQVDKNSPIAMSSYLFGQMGITASAWQMQGFDRLPPEDYEKLDADKGTVEAVRDMFHECFDLNT